MRLDAVDPFALNSGRRLQVRGRFFFSDRPCTITVQQLLALLLHSHLPQTLISRPHFNHTFFQSTISQRVSDNPKHEPRSKQRSQDVRHEVDNPSFPSRALFQYHCRHTSSMPARCSQHGEESWRSEHCLRQGCNQGAISYCKHVFG